jgi:hypothetical protein
MSISDIIAIRDLLHGSEPELKNVRLGDDKGNSSPCGDDLQARIEAAQREDQAFLEAQRSRLVEQCDPVSPTDRQPASFGK